jgi:hypothetical protein
VLTYFLGASDPRWLSVNVGEILRTTQEEPRNETYAPNGGEFNTVPTT